MSLRDRLNANKVRSRQRGSIASQAQAEINEKKEEELQMENQNGNPNVNFSTMTTPRTETEIAQVPVGDAATIQPNIKEPSVTEALPTDPNANSYASSLRARQIGNTASNAQAMLNGNQVDDTFNYDEPTTIERPIQQVPVGNAPTIQPNIQEPSVNLNLEERLKLANANHRIDEESIAGNRTPIAPNPNATIQPKIDVPTIKSEGVLNQEAEDIKKQYEGTDYESLKNLIAAGANADEISQFLATHPTLWKDVNRAKQEAEEELDPTKKAEREKRDRIERNLVGLANMVGALGNFVNATSTSDGRSVPVADLSTPLAQAQDKDKADRKEKLDQYRAAQAKYGDYLNKIYDNIRARKEKSALLDAQHQNKMAEIKAKNLGGKTPEQIAKENELKMKEIESKAEIAQTNERIAKLKEKLANEKLTEQGQQNAKLQLDIEKKKLELLEKKGELEYPIPNPNGSGVVAISSNALSESTLGKAWEIICRDPELTNAIISSIKVGGGKEGENDGYDRSSKGGSSIKIDEKTIKVAIGIAIGNKKSPIYPELTQYLLGLDPNLTKHKQKPYNTNGSLYDD